MFVYTVKNIFQAIILGLVLLAVVATFGGRGHRGRVAEVAETMRNEDKMIQSDPVLAAMMAAPPTKHILTSSQRAELDRRLAKLPADVAAGRMRSTADMTATIERLRIKQGG